MEEEEEEEEEEGRRTSLSPLCKGGGVIIDKQRMNVGRYVMDLLKRVSMNLMASSVQLTLMIGMPVDGIE